MPDTHYAKLRQQSAALPKACAMISCSPGRRAGFFFVLREAGRSTPMMAADRSTRSCRAILFLFVLISIPRVAQSSTLEDSAKELARKIAAALPAQESVSCEILNNSSLPIEDAARAEQILKTELQDRGIHILSSGATGSVVVTFSENFENFVWTGEIHQGDAPQVVLVVVRRSQEDRGFSNTVPMAIRSEKFWEGREHILDALTMNSSDGSQPLLLLTVDGVLITRNGTDFFTGFSFPPVQAILRNPAGSLTLAGNEVTAIMPQQTCIFSLAPDGLSQCHPGEGPSPGRVFERLIPLGPPAPPHPEWGSQIQEIQSGCGSGTQFLVTGPGDFTQTDFVQLFGSDPTLHRPSGKALSNPLTFAGPVMDLHTDGAGARAVVRNLETGSYEAHRITIECGR